MSLKDEIRRKLGKVPIKEIPVMREIKEISLPSEELPETTIYKKSIADLRSMYRHLYNKDPPHNSEWNKKRIAEEIIKSLMEEIK